MVPSYRGKQDNTGIHINTILNFVEIDFVLLCKILVKCLRTNQKNIVFVYVQVYLLLSHKWKPKSQFWKVAYHLICFPK